MPSEEVIKKAISNGKSTTNGTLNKTSNVISNPNGSVSVNYNDSRFQQVETDKNKALNEIDQTYGDMIGKSDSYYQAQIDASKQWADKQTEIQNQQTDFAIEKIEQEKAKAEKDYTKEQSGAYVDWQKQSNQYGVNAEQMASSGMTNTGYSESSQVAMYNTYQMRVATAREVYNNAVLNYNNAITEARLQNNSALADIAYKALKEQLELGLQGFQYKNQLILDKANKKFEIDNAYYNRFQNVLAQINQENALAEQIRQFNEEKALKEQQLAEDKRQFNESLALQKKKLSSSSSSGGSNKGNGSNGDATIDKTKGDDTINKDKGNDTTPAKSNINVDTKSVLNLGRGPISGDKLADLVDKGQVKAVQKGNTIVVGNTFSSKDLLTGKSTIKGKTPIAKKGIASILGR